MSACVYVSLHDFVCLFLLLPFVLGFCLFDCLGFLCFLLFFVWMICSVLKVRFKVPYYFCVNVDFPFYGCLHLPYVLRCSYLRCINIYNRSVFFLDWPPDKYVVSYLDSCNRLYFKVYCVWYENCYSSFLLVSICME